MTWVHIVFVSHLLTNPLSTLRTFCMWICGVSELICTISRVLRPSLVPRCDLSPLPQLFLLPRLCLSGLHHRNPPVFQTVV